MNKADCFHLGYVAKLHGFKGEVSLFLDVTNPEDYQSLDAVFIEINGQLSPFFIESFKLKNKGFAAVKFEGVNTESEARILLRKNLFLPEQVLPKLSGTQFYDHEVVGFTATQIPNIPVSSFADVLPTFDVVGYQQLGPPASGNAARSKR